MLERGAIAPGFTLLDSTENPVSLGDFRGSWVVVYFYPEANTPGCTTEACGFRDRHAAVETDVTVMGISADPPADLADFKARYDLPFTLLSDPDGRIATMYDSFPESSGESDRVQRNTYIVDPAGRIAQAYAAVEPNGHAKTVLEDLANLRDSWDGSDL